MNRPLFFCPGLSELRCYLNFCIVFRFVKITNFRLRVTRIVLMIASVASYIRIPVAVFAFNFFHPIHLQMCYLIRMDFFWMIPLPDSRRVIPFRLCCHATLRTFNSNHPIFCALVMLFYQNRGHAATLSQFFHDIKLLIKYVLPHVPCSVCP